MTQALKIDETDRLTPKWNADGLISAIAVDHDSGAFLMLAHMNKDALETTLATGEVVYWSRSRKKLWRKGETSGNTQKLIEAYIDCDQDALLLRVKQTGPACHTGRASCFYRRINLDVKNVAPTLIFDKT